MADIDKRIELLLEALYRDREETLQLKQSIVELRASQAETDRQMKETDRQMRQASAEADRRIKKLERLRDDLGLTQGEVAEDAIRRSAKIVMDGLGMKVNTVISNQLGYDEVTKKKAVQYDLFVVNGSEIVVVEVKNKVTENHINDFINKQLPKFRKYFPAYKDYTVYGGVGGLVVKDEVEKYAEKKGLYVFTQNGNSFTAINTKGFKPKIFG